MLLAIIQTYTMKCNFAVFRQPLKNIDMKRFTEQGNFFKDICRDTTLFKLDQISAYI